MQNSTFLVLLRPIFAPKLKTAPPTGLGSRSCEGLPVIWTRKVKFFFSGAHPKFVRLILFLFKTFFFSKSPNFGWKNRFKLDKDLFFGDHLILTEKPLQFGSRLMKLWVKFVYCCFHLSKKPPPPLQNPGYASSI